MCVCVCVFAGVEASLYAALMSVNNLSGGLGGILGGFATKMAGVTESDFTNLPLLVVGTNLSGLLPLPFLFLLPKQTTDSKGECRMPVSISKMSKILHSSYQMC